MRLSKMIADLKAAQSGARWKCRCVRFSLGYGVESASYERD